MRLALHTAEIVGITALLLGLAALPAHGNSLGELTTAPGVHSNLARGGGSSSTGALKSVKSSLSKSTKSRDFDSGASFGTKPARKSGGSKSSGSRSSSGGSGGRGSWVSGSEVSRGSNSSAWAQGGNGWGTSGGGGRRSPARRPKS